MEVPTIDISSGIAEDLGPQMSNIIRVIGVGGAGGNAVNNMYEVGIQGVDYIICNTDKQALEHSKVPTKVQIGKRLTEGLGAGNKPERGRDSAIEDIDEIKSVLEGAKMVFVTAGMGGGTGTGAAPVIAKLAMDMNILTIGIVSIPYECEGGKRIKQAIRGIEEMEKCVDSLLVVNSERLNDMYGNLPLRASMKKADEVLAMAAKGLAEIITVYGGMNVDFADVDSAMRLSGVALIGTATASGENRAMEAVKNAIHSPLLNNNKIKGSQHIIVNMTSSDEYEVTQKEMALITNYLRTEADFKDNDDETEEDSLIWGSVYDNNMGEELRVTVVATGFSTEAITGKPLEKAEPVRLGSNGEIISSKDEDEEAAHVIDLTDPKKPGEYTEKIKRLYDPGANTPTETYSTKNLADPTIVSFESLKSEEVISNIENIPAYARRSGNK
ncbi:MAG: cell division protein FtsZ [Bacteroidales bacterium]|nr:cell division protein FtsZ [Bacteroidales bacterium]